MSRVRHRKTINPFRFQRDVQRLRLLAADPHHVADLAVEPDRETVLNGILPLHLKIQIWRATLESLASEMGARMTAMEAATKNAGEMIDNLTLLYNRTRQAAITKELIEIVSGAQALGE